jgi:hypothetical protein
VSELDNAFGRLLDRQPTDKDRQALYRVRDALGLKSTDAVWLLLMALQHYETLYEQIPHRIADAARDATKVARVTAEAQAKAAQAEAQKTLADAVHRSAVASARQAAGAQLFKWVSIVVSVVTLSLITVGRWQFRRGDESGVARGENQAKKQCERATAAAAWVSSPEGRLAYELGQVGSLRDLATCSGRGVAARDGWCVVQPERGKAFRWRLPLSSSDR